jgi:hypothetical protein
MTTQREQPANPRVIRVNRGFEDRYRMAALGQMRRRSRPQLFTSTPEVCAGTKKDETRQYHSFEIAETVGAVAIPFFHK